MELIGQKVKIRRPRMEDAEANFRWFSNPAVTAYLPLAGKGNIPLENIRSFLKSAIEHDRPNFTIAVESSEGRLIGNGGFREFVEGESAEISLIIGEPDYWGRGYGKEAMELLLQYGFDVLGLKEIWLVVRADNERGIRLFHSLGFRQKDLMKNAVTIDGIPKDKIKMALKKNAS